MVIDVVGIPREIRDLHKIVTLSMDIFFVNGIPFLLTLSHNLCFTTITHLADRTIETTYKAFKGIFIYYLQRGFQITVVTADGEFAPLQQLMVELPGSLMLNLASANENEPYMERRIWVVKEWVRCICHSLPFTSIPKVMVTYMIFYAVKLLNYFPAKGGAPDFYSPKAILSGEAVHYKYYNMPFGSYCQVQEENAPRNSMDAQTQGALLLGPSGNVQGGLSLTMAKVITRRAWNLLPMPMGVLERIHTLAKDQPSLLTFTDHQGHKIGDTDPTFSQPSTLQDEVDIPGMIRDAVDIPGVDDTPGTEAADGVSDDPALENDVNMIPGSTPTESNDGQPVVFESTTGLAEHTSAPSGEHDQESAPLPVVMGTPP
jgi:hypothetical protein